VVYEINVVHKKDEKKIMTLEGAIKLGKKIIGICPKKNELDIFP